MAITAADLVVKYSSQGEDKVAQGAQRAGRAVSGFAGVVQTAAGFLGAQLVTSAFQAARGVTQFGAAMANVNSIAQLSGKGIDELSNQVLALTSDPRIAQGPATLAAGLYDIYSSGFQGVEGMRVLEQSALAATAGVTDTATASRAITAALNAYSLTANDAAHVSDVLFQTVNDGVITFEQLANNLGNTLPIANSLGIGIEELGAAYAQMTLKGVQASQAETQIAALMRSALNPTESLTAAVEAHGFASAEAAIESEGLAGFLAILNDAAGGSNEAMFDLLGTQEAMNAATILGEDGVKGYIAEVDKMNKASEGAGSTNKALAKQMESASFQIQKAKQSLQTLAVIGFGLLAPIISRVAQGLTRLIQGSVIPFVKIIGAATKGNFQFNKLIGDLPQPLQRAAHAIGVVVEGLSDIVSILRGRLDWSRLPGELHQIAGGFQAIAEEIAEGARVAAEFVIDSIVSITGWLWDNKGAIWEGIKDFVGWTADTFTQAISVVIDGAITLGGDLADVAGNIWGWVKGQLFGGSGATPTQGGARGAPRVGLPGAAQGGTNTVNIGTIDVLAALGGVILQGITDASVWVGEQIETAIGAVNVEPQWFLQVNAPSGVTFGEGFGSGEQFGNWLQDQFPDIPVELSNWKLIFALPLAVTMPLWIPLFIAVKIGGPIIGAVAGFIAGAVSAFLPDWFKSGITSAALTAQDIGDAIKAKIGEIADISLDINILPNINVKDPVVSGASWVWDFLKKGLIPLQVRGGGGIPTGEQAAANLEQAFAVTIDPPDMSAWNSAVAESQTLLTDIQADLNFFANQTFTAKLALDNTLVTSALGFAKGWGDDFALLVYTADLDFSTLLAFEAKNAAIGWGTTFAEQVYTADLNFNNSQAAQAYTDAFSWGNAWEQAGFTATLYLNTGPAINAALAAVQFIDSLLPHSLAKQGPLSKSPNFDYIADAFAASMGKIGRSLDRTFSGIGGRPASPVSVTVNNYGGGGGGMSSATAIRRQLEAMGRR